MINRLYSIVLENWKEKVQGIMIAEGTDWTIMAYIPIAYTVKGFILINRKYIKNITRGDEDIFKEKVLKVNNKLHIDNSPDIPLNTTDLFEFLYENKYVFELYTKRKDEVFIGYIDSKLEKSIRLKPIDSRGIWMDYNYLFRISSIRVILFDTDYVNCLINYNKTIQNQDSQ